MGRQTHALVLLPSPVGGAVSSAGVVTCIASIGKCRAQSSPKTLMTAAATVVLTITSPVCAVAKAQNDMVR